MHESHLSSMQPLIKLLAPVGLLLLFAACSSHPSADSIIKKAITKAGGKKYEYSLITFNFRGTRYSVKQQGGHYIYKRTFADSTGTTITDSLTNSGFARLINGKKADLPKDRISAYSNSLNSVIYFVRLPYGLSSSAVQKTYLGMATIKGKPYYQIGVTFKQEGGGDGYNDKYMFWFGKEDYAMDYLAYNYPDDGGETRFRQAENIRHVKGIRFADYINFTGLPYEDSLQNYTQRFNKDNVEKFSDIKQDQITVTLLDSTRKSQK